MQPFECNICEFVFKTKGTLKRHIQSLHEGKKPFKCKICDTSFAKMIGFNSHMVSNHEEKGALQCDICDAIFANNKPESFQPSKASQTFQYFEK